MLKFFKTEVDMKKNSLLKDAPLISVLVPMYNTEKTISRCIKSILRQTYTNLEIVLLDDGSQDNTYNIANKFAKQDSRIKLLHKVNEKNISKTRNYLLNNYSGDYVVWVDSDDVLHKKYVEKLYTTITSKNADLGICGFNLMFANLLLCRPLFAKTKVFENEKIYSNVILNHRVGFMLWNKIFKHEIIKDIRFDESVGFGEDFAFVYKYLKQTEKVAYNNDKLYKYIVRPGSETTKKFSAKKMTFVSLLENLVKEENDEFIKNTIYSWLAFTGVSMLFLAKKSKYDNIEDLQKLYDTTHTYKNYFKKNKDVKFIHKLIMFFGLKFWARKRPKIKQK